MTTRTQFVAIVATLLSLTPTLADSGAVPQPTTSPFLSRMGDKLYYTPSNCCGLVAAYLIIGEFRGAVPLSQLATELPVTPTGTPMNDLASTLESKGFDTLGIEVSTQELNELLNRYDGLLAVALVNNNHWVTLHSARSDTFEYYSYPKWRTVSSAEFDKIYSGKVLLVGRDDHSLDMIRNSESFFLRNSILSLICICIIIVIIFTIIKAKIARVRIRRDRL